jgi:uncharacterized membrane protein YphA (DoxX/SURF4 family)
VFIGWHFFYEGLAKLFNPNWSASSYLEYSQWLFSGIFHSMAENTGILAVVDFLNIWGLIFIGLGLLLGTFTRIASISGALLLLLYYTANPPFMTADAFKEGNYMIIDKNLVEMMALCLIAIMPSYSFFDIKYIKEKIRLLFLKKSKKVDNQNIQQIQVTEPVKKNAIERRKFLINLGALPVLGVFSFGAIKNFLATNKNADVFSGATTIKFDFTDVKDLKGTLPIAKIGGVELSRMIMGCNLIGGWAHSRDLIYVPSLVKKYHTKQKVFETLLLGEQCGMNAIILNTSLCPLINSYWKEARGKIQFISDCAGVGDVEKGIQVSIDSGAAMCYIQGEITEKLLREKKSMEVVGEWLEKIRSHKVPAGIGAHSLEVIKQCVELGIKPDYWVKTIHNTNYWSARPDELPHHDNIWCTNPEETARFMSTLEEPWIGFKVLAAGAIRPKDGFKFAFENGADIICVGMYDFQIVDDVNIASEILSQNITRERPWRC